MANETRRFANFLGGTVNNNPLLVASTSFDSDGLMAMPEITAVEHIVVVFDPDGDTGEPFARRVIGHEWGAPTATLELGTVYGTLREVPQGTPWVHTVLVEDLELIGSGFLDGGGPVGTGSELYVDAGGVDAGGVGAVVPSVGGSGRSASYGKTLWASNSGTLALPNNSWTGLPATFMTSVSDDLGLAWSDVDGTGYIIQQTGLYRVRANVTATFTAFTGYFEVDIMFNGDDDSADVEEKVTITTTSHTAHLDGATVLNAGTHVVFDLYQNSGAAATVTYVSYTIERLD